MNLYILDHLVVHLSGVSNLPLFDSLQIINFPMDTAKAHSVKKACLSTTIWTDVLVWSEPFETLSDACRVINKALSVKGRLDAIHIYQSLNCKVGALQVV